MKKEWLKIYRYNGGSISLLHCILGTLRLYWGDYSLPDTIGNPRVESITFSVVPRLTELWARFISQAVTDESFRIIVGDCSGGFRSLSSAKPVHTIHLYNHPHGKKLDLFLNKVCTSEYVIISDDDVFWLNSLPWTWSVGQFEADPHLAVISLMPRDRVSSVLAGVVEQPMGSYCLILRREIWLREKLSFKVVYPPSNTEYDWYYDTADYANVQLLGRGYKVLVAPVEIRQFLVAFEGVSSWILKIQEAQGDISENLRGIPLRQEKALRAILIAEGIAELLGTASIHSPPDFAPHELLIRARQICERMLANYRVEEIHVEVEGQLEKLGSSIPPTIGV